MRHIVNHGPRYAAWLLLLPILAFVARLFWHIGPAPAQSQTYEYIGPDFSIPTCEGLTGQGSPPCTNGSIIGSVRLNGVTATYSGSKTNASVSSYALSSGGIAAPLTSLSDLDNPVTFGLSSGQITTWAFGATHSD